MYGDIRCPFLYLVHIPADKPDVFLGQIAHPIIQDRGSQWGGYTGPDEAEDTKCLKKVFEWNTFRDVDGQGDVQDTMSDPFQEVGQIEAFDIKVGMNQEIPLVSTKKS